MNKVTVYGYAKCSTCRNAMKWLKNRGYEIESVEVFEHPPTSEQLKTLIEQSGLDIKKFFNTSGEVYREMNLKDRLPQLNEEQQRNLLASNGRLIKRPIVTDGQRTTVGFKEAELEKVWPICS